MINTLSKIDKHKTFELLIGVIGIYISFLFTGIKYQKIVSTKYVNSFDSSQQSFFRLTSGFVLIERAINWILGEIYQHFTLPKEKRISIPNKNSAYAASMIYLSSIATTESMYFVSYPLIIMAKSCSLVSVILVGICCSRVRSKQLKLEKSKIVIVTIVTVGILLFRFFDPKANFDDNKQTQLFGIFLLVASLFTDGFIPDFQAQIKEKYKPQPIEMLITINKWCAIFALIHVLGTFKLFELYYFCTNYMELMIDLVLLSLVTFVGQIFVYRMIKEFKQHLVPFVITTRKIVTVGLSIVYFGHKTSVGQVISIFVVLFATGYQFFVSIRKPQPHELQGNAKILALQNQNIKVNKDNFKELPSQPQFSSNQQCIEQFKSIRLSDSLQQEQNLNKKSSR